MAGGAQRSPSQRPLQRLWRNIRLIVLLLIVVIAMTVILLLPMMPSRASVNLNVGDIVQEDIIAPRDVTYVSQIETEAARQEALASVEDIYDPPDSRVGRAQVRRARQMFDFIEVVRMDPYVDGEQRMDYVHAIPDLVMDDPYAETLLNASDSEFEQVEREIVSLIEETMSGTLTEQQVAGEIRELELRVSTDLPETLIPVSVTIAGDLIRPNSLLNTTLTSEAQEQAVANVPDIRISFQEGEVVARAGEPVTELDLEALDNLGLLDVTLTINQVGSAFLLSLLSCLLIAFFIVTLRTQWLEQPGQLYLLGLLLLFFVLGAQVMVPGLQSFAYLFPLAALAMAVTSLYGTVFSSLIGLVVAALIGYLTNSVELMLFYAVSVLLAAGSLRNTARLNGYFISGVVAAFGSIAVLLIFRLPDVVEPVRLAQLISVTLLGGLLSAGLALVILFLVGNLTGMVTGLRLLDLSRADQTLQRQLQRSALGTYQHSLSVATLAESAAEAIGADALLTRVGCLYHDMGKMNNPAFFGENRVEGGMDPHKGLSPLASARIIIQHVTDGAKILQRHRLPPAVVDFAREHHGTMPVLFFLANAREEASDAGVDLDEAEYYYPGPIPQTRESGIVMLCDACESATRAARPTTSEQIEEIVNRIIDQRLEYNQLDESGLTLQDIRIVRESIIRTLKGMYHPRVQYPASVMKSRAEQMTGESGDGEVEEAKEPDKEGS